MNDDELTVGDLPVRWVEPRDPDPGMIVCPDCGEPLEVDVMIHPHESGSLIGVARGFKPHECKP